MSSMELKTKKVFDKLISSKSLAVHECCSDHLVERFDKQLTSSPAVHSDVAFVLLLHLNPDPFTQGWTNHHLLRFMKKVSCTAAEGVCTSHPGTATHAPPDILSLVFTVSSSRFLTKNSLQWVLMEHVGSVPRLPERELCGWLLMKHDLACVSSLILSLTFNDAPYFAFFGPFHLFKWLVCRLTDSCNWDWQVVMLLLNRWPGSLVTRRAKPVAKAVRHVLSSSNRHANMHKTHFRKMLYICT